jgi:hypothetical protein
VFAAAGLIAKLPSFIEIQSIYAEFAAALRTAASRCAIRNA